MVPAYEPSYEEIKDLALKLYLGKNPKSTSPSDEKLKLGGYWRQARLILLGKKEKPKYVQKAYYSDAAHLERLQELLEWAKTNAQIQRCLKRQSLKKALRLIKEKSIEQFGVSTRHANEYAEIILTRLKIKREIYTKWGFL
jgi:hypothetical protein